MAAATWHALSHMSLTGLVCILGSAAYHQYRLLAVGRLLRDYTRTVVRLRCGAVRRRPHERVSARLRAVAIGRHGHRGRRIAVMLLSKRAGAGCRRMEEKKMSRMCNHPDAFVMFAAVMFSRGPNNIMLLSSG